LDISKENLVKVYELSITPDIFYYHVMNNVRIRPTLMITLNQNGYIDALIDEYLILADNKTLTPVVVDFDDNSALLELLFDNTRTLYLSNLGSLL